MAWARTALRGTLLLVALGPVAAYDNQGTPAKHLIVSTPSASKVWWSNNTQDISDPADVELVLDSKGTPMVPQLDMHMLISPADVTYPMGLALERKHAQNEHGVRVAQRHIFVADPGADCEVMHVSRFLLLEENGVFSVSEKKVVMEEKCVRWIAVDTVGNVFATCEETGEILKIPALQIQEYDAGEDEIKPPLTLYSSTGPNAMQVTMPGGIAADTFYLYWSNKVMGGKTGSIVKGNSFRPAGRKNMNDVLPIARNADAGRDYGVCIAGKTVFYTEKENMLYAVQTNGGAISIVSDMMQQPRGCAWDRDGTIYVADRAAGRVYSFPSSTRNLRTVGKLKRVAMLDDPFGVLVVDRAAPLGPAVAVVAILSAAFALLER